jgi:hypothetical protein
MQMVPTAVYNIKNYWVSELCLSSWILKYFKRNVSETGYFHHQVSETQLGPLERANIQWLEVSYL